MPYVTIFESQFDEFMNVRGYQPITLKGVNEKVYSKNFGDLDILCFSTIEAGKSREAGSDAIRLVMKSKKFGVTIGGETKTLRTSKTDYFEVLERLESKMNDLEKKAELYSNLYTKIPFYQIDTNKIKDMFEQHKDVLFLVLSEIKEGETKQGKPNVRLSFRTNFHTEKMMYINVSITTMRDNIGEFLSDKDEEGDLFQLLSNSDEINSKSYRDIMYISLGNYGYVFKKSDFYLTHVKQLPLTFPEELKPASVDNSLQKLKQVMDGLKEGLNEVDSKVDNKEPDSDIVTVDTKVDSVAGGNDVMPKLEYVRRKVKLNPMQQKVYDSNAIQDGKNIIVASPTASGKSVIAEMGIDRSFQKYKMSIYVAPLKSLVEEKMEDWRELYPDLNIQILTGDFELTEKQQSELSNADLIVMTCEMLNSRCVKHRSENNTWLKDVECLIIDEVHLIGSVGRGDKLECSLIQFAGINKKAQMILLSATLSHLDKLVEWITDLNGKDTILIESDYRPVKLNVIYEKFNDGWSRRNFDAKYAETERIIQEHRDDKFIVFCQSRKDSRTTSENLREAGFKAETHNAMVTREERLDIERRFKTGDLQIICATPTLAQGVNMPARRVIVQSVYRGMQEIDAIEIQQCIGRAGRPKYDTEGWAHVILPDSEFNIQKARINHIELTSVLSRKRDLLFALNNEIFMGNIEDFQSAEQWWEKTFAFKLAKDKIPIDGYIAMLEKMGMIEWIESKIHITKLGRVSASMYQYPDVVLGWSIKFKAIVENSAFDSDILMAHGLVSMDDIEAEPYVMKDEQQTVQEFYENKIMPVNGILKLNPLMKPEDKVLVKHIMRYWNCLTDTGIPAINMGIRADCDRTIATLKLLDAMVGWHKQEEWTCLGMRLKYGVGRELIPLVQLRGIGHVRATKLYQAGIPDWESILKHTDVVRGILGDVIADDVIRQCEYKTGRRKLFKVGA